MNKVGGDGFNFNIRLYIKMEREKRNGTPLHKKMIGIGIGLGLVVILIYIFKKYGFSIPLFGPQTAPGKAVIYWDLGKMFKNMWRK